MLSLSNKEKKLSKLPWTLWDSVTELKSSLRDFKIQISPMLTNMIPKRHWRNWWRKRKELMQRRRQLRKHWPRKKEKPSKPPLQPRLKKREKRRPLLQLLLRLPPRPRLPLMLRLLPTPLPPRRQAKQLLLLLVVTLPVYINQWIHTFLSMIKLVAKQRKKNGWFRLLNFKLESPQSNKNRKNVQKLLPSRRDWMMKLKLKRDVKKRRKKMKLQGDWRNNSRMLDPSKSKSKLWPKN